jgi:tetratricopeptide (TPR) repeat protein
MKTIKYLFTVTSIVFFVLTGCNDDKFLEEKPKSIYTIENAFDKSSQVEAQLTMCYIRLYNWYGKTSNPWTSIYQYKSFGTDVLDYPYWRHDGASGYSNFGTWSTTSSHVQLVWNELYQVVSYANLTLLGSEIESIAWTSEDFRKNIIAEARFFRGFSYLRLGEVFGGVPIVDKFSEELKFDYVRSTREQTYLFAIEDLQYAYENLPDYPAVDGRTGKGAAAHMLAEAYLALGVETGNHANYTNAVNYATATINLHPLMTSRFGVRANPADVSDNRNVPTYFPEGNVFGDLFFPGNYDRSVGNTEAVWTFQTPTYEQADETGGQSGSEPMFFSFVARDLNWAPEYVESGAAAGPWKAVSPKYNTATAPAYLGGFGISEARATDYALYHVWTDSTDLRYQEDVTVRTSYICTDPNHSMYEKKVPVYMLDRNPTNLSKYSPTFAKIIPLDEWSYRNTDNFHAGYSHDNYGIRSAETYLLLSEAYLRSNQKELAAEAVNTVRRRAQCKTMYTAGNIDINSILDERIRECLFEEGRWFTLLRMEPEVWKQRIYDHGMFIADYPRYNLPVKWDLWPIPQSIRDLNAGAEFPQNPGWE